jgi:hypothetical protein
LVKLSKREQKQKTSKRIFIFFPEIPWLNRRRIAKLAATITKT